MFAKVYLIRIGLLAIIINALVACAGDNELPTSTVLSPPATEASPTLTAVVSHGGPVVDYFSLIDSLRAVGATVEPAGEVSQPYFTVPGQVITVNGADVQVYEYPDADAVNKEAAFISKDGGQATVPGGPVTMIEWLATSHFYSQGRLIVLYVGDDPGVISTLEAVLGPQFAGGVSSVLDPRPAANEGLTFNMLPLPLDRPISGQAANYVPHAWLIVADKVIPPTYGSYTVSYPDQSAPKAEGGEVVMVAEHADAVPPETNPDLATATLAADEQAIVVLSSKAVGKFTARVAAWNDLYGPSEHTLKAQRELVGQLTAFTLEPAGNPGDQLLAVAITFDRGEATYFWRLNPATASQATPAPVATSPAPEAEGQARPIEPVVTAARLSFLGWSPDGKTLAYLEHTAEDLAVLEPFPPGHLKFLNASTGQICDSPIEFPEGDYYRPGLISWLPDGNLLVKANEQVRQGTPCGEFRLASDQAAVEAAAPDLSLSPGDGHRATTEVRESSGGILSLVTTIVNLSTGQAENVVEWQIDERLGDLGLGGEWLTGDTFLIYETLDQGPLLVMIGREPDRVAVDLFGLTSVPSILDPEGVSLRAAASTVGATGTYHLALAGVGLEANFPPIRLYHSETREVEELPFRYLGWPAFSAGGRWLVLEAQLDQGGYERSEIWLRPVDSVGSEARRLTDKNIALSVWSPDWTKVAGGSPEGISIFSIPDGVQDGVWAMGDYAAVPQAWSPNGEFLAASGFLPDGQGEALFVIPTAEEDEDAVAAQPGWQSYFSQVFQVKFQYPAGWQPIEGYEERYGGPDGFAQVSALSGLELTVDEACELEAGHHLQPYGSQPQQGRLRIQGQEACLILPSADQPEDMHGQAVLVAQYPQPVQIRRETYAYLILWADRDHIGTIVDTLEFGR